MLPAEPARLRPAQLAWLALAVLVVSVGYVASLLLMLVPALAGLWGIYALRGTTGFFVAADWVGSWAGEGALPSVLSAQLVVVLSALLGAVMMLRLAATLPASRTPDAAAQNDRGTTPNERTTALWWMAFRCPCTAQLWLADPSPGGDVDSVGARPGWWSVIPAEFTRRPTGSSRF